MGVRTLAKTFYLQLACANIKRNRRTYLPHILATAVISGVYLLIQGLLYSDSLNNLPTGKTASMIFSFGLVVYALFAFFFMTYINNLLIRRRKREFGLYAILGLEKRHIARVLFWENLITLSIGLLGGIVIALVFGQLIFMLLLKIIRAVPGSTFSIAPSAYVGMLGLFFVIFLVTSLINLWQVRLSNPIQLMQSQKRGEKDSKLMIPLAIFGVAALSAAYYFAWTIEVPSIALGVFFLLVILVILATHALFSCGSIVFLRLLKKNKRLYYRQENFIALSGLVQRMKQNARSLAMICVLSCMMIVSVSGTLSLYLGQEEMLAGMYPYDVEFSTRSQLTEEEALEAEKKIVSIAQADNVLLSADPAKLIYELGKDEEFTRNNFVYAGETVTQLDRLLYVGDRFRFDAEGEYEDCLKFIDDLKEFSSAQYNGYSVWDVFTARQDGYGTYGGLLFLGAFFGILFLAVTVLIIYFKQISEGYEDREQYVILQKVGMDDKQVRASIDRQVLFVFFVPLVTTVLHMIFASKIIARMLMTFMLYDWVLVLSCIGGVLVLFALMYFVVYRLTARVYYRIVKW